MFIKKEVGVWYNLTTQTIQSVSGFPDDVGISAASATIVEIQEKSTVMYIMILSSSQ